MAQVPRHPDNTRADDSDVHARLRTIRVHGCPGRVLTRFSLRLRSNGILTEIYLPANLQRQRAAYERMIGQWMKDSQSQDLAANRILFKQAPASSAAVLLVQQNHFHFAKPPQLNHLSATWKPSAVSHLARASEAICLNNSKVKFQFKRLHMAVRCHSRDLLGGKAVYIVWGVNGRTMEC
ncbi:hypothetical protein BCR39DRAFT_547608 [Naematelia encephala]|uniref:Uncharacterized protein n=1 Tax=Naematelia encephala TaxID=71784 RepID=A0A1Y2ANE1_9TREE|nr:hypothetical protein BCR39DRAFT_547608 [Naematelia encephala]